MSTMVDEKDKVPKQNNIKGLTQDFVEKLDAKMHEMRKGTVWEHVRPADAKLFMLAARHQRSIADLSKALGISRQAAHKSVQRLVGYGVIELQRLPENNRDKIVVITEAGNSARIMAAKSLRTIESDIEDKVGKERMEALRQTLLDLLV